MSQCGILFRVLLILSGVFTSISAFAQIGFPYCESFQHQGLQRNTVLGGSAVLTDGVLRLTDTGYDLNGYVYIDVPFSSSFGLKASFEYFCYGGTGADGLSVFLFDGTVTNFRPGGFGGSLGYAQREGMEGLLEAYLGVGIDIWGNFGNQVEGKVGGFPGLPDELHPHSVVIRGPAQEGYPFIQGKKVNEAGDFGLDQEDRFSLSSGLQRAEDINTIGFRKVFLELKPIPGESGFLLSLDMLVTTEPNNPRIVTVFDHIPYSYQAPSHLKIGFGASTGGYTNNHEIRNLVVEVSDEDRLMNPVAEDLDEIISCAGQENQYQIDESKVNLPNENSFIQCIRFYASVEDIEVEESDVCLQGKCKPENSVLELDHGIIEAADGGGGFTFSPFEGTEGETVEVYYTVTDNYGKTSAGNSLRLSINTSPAPIEILAEGLPIAVWNICPGTELNLSAAGSEAYERYEWYKDDQLLADSDTPLYIANTVGVYQVWGYNEQGCPSKSEFFTIEQPPMPDLAILDTVVVCNPGEPLDITQYIEDYNGELYDYTIVTPEGDALVDNELYTVYNEGTHFISAKGKGQDCWSEELEFRIREMSEPLEAAFDYGIDGTERKSDDEGGVLIDDPIWFSDLSTGLPVGWNWDFGNGRTSTLRNPVHVFGEKGDFLVTLTVSNEGGCESIAQMNININKSYRIMFPTGFTPTSSQNTHFRPKTKGIVKMELLIFNGWGELLFQSEDLNTLGWDGSVNGLEAPPGGYVYRVNLESQDGDTIVKTGKFLLVR